MRLASITLALALLSACSTGPASPPAPSYDEETLRLLFDDLHAFVSDLSCRAPDECRTISFGGKPCGGPWHCVMYSSATVDEEALRRKVEFLSAYEAGYVEERGIISDCALFECPIRPDCVGGHCADRAPASD